jgi:fatty acid desaturase
MGAEFFKPGRRPATHAPQETVMIKSSRSRKIHRWVAVIFTLTVAGNFAAMPWGQPPAWLTYAPLPPLLFLMVTGLTMLVSSWLRTARVEEVRDGGSAR